MSSGAYHYRRAEALIAAAQEVVNDVLAADSLLREAQVHATLAQVAGTVDTNVVTATSPAKDIVALYADWRDALTDPAVVP